MKTLKIVSVALTTSLALMPLIGNASPEKRSAAACAQALAAALTTNGSAAPVYRLNYKGDSAESLTAAYYTDRYTFDMMARDPKTGADVARATCTTSKSGTVLELSTLPLIESSTKLASGY